MLLNTGINKIILVGQILTQPVEKVVDGLNFYMFTMVTHETIKKGTESINHKEYHNIRAPGKLVDFEASLLVVGQTIYMEGALSTTSKLDAQKIRRYDLEIIARKLEPLSLLPVDAV